MATMATYRKTLLTAVLRLRRASLPALRTAARAIAK
jgi:hypothetical protein